MEILKTVYLDIDQKYWNILNKSDILNILNELTRIISTIYQELNDHQHFAADISIWSDNGDIIYSKNEFIKHFSRNSTYKEVKISSSYPNKQFSLCFSIKPPYTKSFIFIMSRNHTLPEVEDIILEIKVFIEDIYCKRINQLLSSVAQKYNNTKIENSKEINKTVKTNSVKPIGKYLLVFLEIIRNILKLFSS